MQAIAFCEASVLIEAAHLVGIAVSFGCGLLIGVEREHRKRTGASLRRSGIRTFALAGLVGGLTQVLGGSLVPAGAMLVLTLAAIARWRDPDPQAGIASELALFLCFLLGVAAIDNPALAAGVAVVVAITLNLRSPLHRFARVTLTPVELRDALILASAALVVRPLLPDSGSPWLLGVNLKTLWTVAILIMTIQGAAHIALRIAGPRLGLSLAGFASGLVSSVATIAAMGGRLRDDACLRDACVAGALLSNVSTFALLWVLALTIAPDHLFQLVPVLAAGTFAAVGVALLALRGQHRDHAYVPLKSHAFSIWQALLFALGLSAVTVIVAYANLHFGAEAGLAGAALAGFFDAHAAAGSALSLLAAGRATANDALLAFLLAISTNMVSKVVAAAASGGKAFAVRTGSSLLVVLLAVWMPYVFSLH